VNEKTIKALVDAGAIKRACIIAEGARFHVEVDTKTGSITASTLSGGVKTWVTLDAAAKWLRSLGIGKAFIDVDRWQPGQRSMRL